MTRTHDLLITNQLHYRLCYTSIFYCNGTIITDSPCFVKIFSQKRFFIFRDGKFFFGIEKGEWVCYNIL